MADSTDNTDIAARVEFYADAILRAAGSGLRHYSMQSTRAAILMATMAAYEEAYRAGAANVLDRVVKWGQSPIPLRHKEGKP